MACARGVLVRDSCHGVRRATWGRRRRRRRIRGPDGIRLGGRVHELLLQAGIWNRLFYGFMKRIEAVL